MNATVFTSESVTEGHPDKVCDSIADAILDDILAKDTRAHVAVEVMCTTGLVMVVGEVSCDCYSDMNGIARRTLQEIGYHSPAFGFDGATCGVLVSIDEQSSDIAGGVGVSEEAREGTAVDEFDRQGAGDQGMMFGFACRESEALSEGTFMPLPIFFAHRLAKQLAEVRKSGAIDYIGPDGKTQVTLRYENGAPVAVEQLIVAAEHKPDIDAEKMKREMLDAVVAPIVPEKWFPEGKVAPERVLVNPSGKFVKGGPLADSGLTGRKIIVDTYGGYSRHGGGSFSGKDPSKVDRSGSYYARYAAKNLVAAGVAEKLEIQVAYAIGCAHPVSINACAFGTETVPVERIEGLLRSRDVFDFRPAAIIKNLNLIAPIYRQVSAYGHFGRWDLDLPWERLDKVDAIRQALK